MPLRIDALSGSEFSYHSDATIHLMDERPVASTEADPPLEWTFNPWRHIKSPWWQRRYVVLLLSILVCLLAGYTLNVPNYPQKHIESLELKVQSSGLTAQQIEAGEYAAEQEENAAAFRELAEIRRQERIWPYQTIGWSFVSLLLLLAMTITLYVPVHYKLDSSGVTVYFLGVPTSRKWDHYRNYYMHDTGVHITTMAKPSRLDPFRGHYLQFVDNRQEVADYIGRHMTLKGIPEGQEPTSGK